MDNIQNNNNDKVNEDDETSPPAGGNTDDTGDTEEKEIQADDDDDDDSIEENQPEYKCATLVETRRVATPFTEKPEMKIPENAKAIEEKEIEKYTNWNTNEAPKKPDLFVLERTTFVVEKDVPTLARELQNTFKLRSVHVLFEGASAKCKTADFTKFHINLYDAGDGKVNVEVQRRNGCCMAFRDEYLEIIKVVDGMAVKTPDEVAEERKPNKSLKEALGDKYIPLPEGVVERNLSSSLKSLQTKKSEQVTFAMKELVSLSGSSETALEASKLLLADEKYEDIRSHILSVIQDHDQEEESKEYSRNLALNLFANIMGALSDAKILSNYIESEIFTKQIVDHLMTDINKKTAAKFPANVCLALKCLFYLITNSPAARKTAVNFNDEGLVSVDSVRKHGSQCYLNLEKEATNVYDNL